MKIIGQNLALKYLTEGLRTDRLSPSLLFVGPSGVGKRSCAIQLAKCFVCQSPSFESVGTDLPFCNDCQACERIQNNNHSDLFVLDRSSQAVILGEKTESQSSIKIEAIRYVEKFLQLKPTESKKRVVVVDEAQKMTNDAANAFLKILEEPPQNAQIILIANDQKNLPMTIASRCALVRFSPVSPRLIEEWLVEDQHLLIDKAHDAAERSGGSFEKVLEVLEEGFSDFDLSQYELDEFFDEISKASWRKEGRKQAENVLNQLIENAQKKLEKGDLSQIEPLKELLKTRVAIDRHVNPRLALENIYLKLYPPFLDTK